MPGKVAQLELADALADLYRSADAANAFVFDAWGAIWCSASITWGDDQSLLHAQVRTILEQLHPPVQQGGSLNQLFSDQRYPMYCTSFNTHFVLAAWLLADTNQFRLRRLCGNAIPRIAELTMAALPEPGGA